MKKSCPNKCQKTHQKFPVIGYGSYFRTSDRNYVQRYKCTYCNLHFSTATGSKSFNQKKRQINYEVFNNLISGVSIRRSARLLKCSTNTISAKLQFLANRACHKNYKYRVLHPLISNLQFDDLETLEHTKLKPLSVTLAVEKSSRFILGFEVSKMPAKGLLSKKALKKYGYRKDERQESRERLFRRIEPVVSKTCLIESDENPHYPQSVKKYFPLAEHFTVAGRRGCVTGQGELKKVEFDPLFSLNHTCAMMRANINRLFRKTWCTTKKIQALRDHIELYVYYHNQVLIKSPSTKPPMIYRKLMLN